VINIDDIKSIPENLEKDIYGNEDNVKNIEIGVKIIKIDVITHQ